jgi:transcriptional regulator GlxA family with amidase domain
VLIIPGGLGTRSPYLNSTIDFVRETYPNLQYLITICTGAGIAARAGVLDGRRATTNKAAWNATVVLGPNVKWVKEARWVVDRNIWTTSGISAGIDGTLAFIDKVYGKEEATRISNLMEYTRETKSHNDPFAEVWGVV